MQGTVKWYNRKKGFGFISGEDGQDYFVHFSALQQGTFIRDNDLVSFDAVDTEKGKQAQNVALVQKGSERNDLPAETKEESPKEEAPEEEAPEEEAEENEEEEELDDSDDDDSDDDDSDDDDSDDDDSDDDETSEDDSEEEPKEE